MGMMPRRDDILRPLNVEAFDPLQHGGVETPLHHYVFNDDAWALAARDSFALRAGTYFTDRFCLTIDEARKATGLHFPAGRLLRLSIWVCFGADRFSGMPGYFGAGVAPTTLLSSLQYESLVDIPGTLAVRVHLLD